MYQIFAAFFPALMILIFGARRHETLYAETTVSQEKPTLQGESNA